MLHTEISWSDTEKKIADKAFKKAYDLETATLISQIRSKASEIVEVDDLWHLHDLLSARRHQLDGKYDHRDSVLIFVFAQLVKEGWLHLDDLKGLQPEKLAKITALTRM
ncbi:conserved hypothetical protein [Gloeothece citriformis PCC 7424]|uniref:Fluorescence recovery protein n=1 Tax=Gloeothece citriformis (strain PCC 7424) TaxID=65393 RepID=B7K963_GLOC7|nr:hypothetical protein [Gloeothece citriformis]ACK72832.1 conserved hypothetical protein [Gloeothece citriformis PCC 7424]